mmetsp:Transcript_63031/g.184332  ORF Transcript_63031/g.184332 Transcript_63031/m.184332 type:complete len:213 (-) Transcript_63031:1028-1666(-)
MNLPWSKRSSHMHAWKKARSLSEEGSHGTFTSTPRSSSISITFGSESSCHAEAAHSISRFDVSAFASRSAAMVALRSGALPPTTRVTVASNWRSVRPRSHRGKHSSHARTFWLLPVMVADMRASYLCSVTAQGFARASSRALTVSQSACPIAAIMGVKPLNIQGRSGTFRFKDSSMHVFGSPTSSLTAVASPENAAHRSNEHPVFRASSSSL